MAGGGFQSRGQIPIQRDERSFEDRQRSIWNQNHGDGSDIWTDMQSRMDTRRKDWEGDVEKMRREFFRLSPTDSLTTAGGFKDAVPGESRQVMVPGHSYIDKGEGQKSFRVSFDVNEFKPEEIDVHTQENKLVVHAKHVETGEGKNVSREFSRSVDIPAHVDIMKLQSTLSKDGILQVEAPVEAPSYEKITQGPLVPPPGIQKQMAGGFHPVPGSSQPILPLSANQIFSQMTPILQSTGPVSKGGGSGLQCGPVVSNKDKQNKLHIVLDIGSDYTPQEVQVKTVDNKLKISAKHEEKKDGRTTVREFSKELELPADVDPNTVTASVSDDGKLIVEAPKLQRNY